jgi:PAS domain S-box-containing protein
VSTLAHSEPTDDRAVLAALPFAVYMTDVEGRITFFNSAATALWGAAPKIGASRWCGFARLSRPDGQAIEPEGGPVATALRERRPLHGVEAVGERSDGTRLAFATYATPLRKHGGEVTGTVNLLVDVDERRGTDIELERLAAIVASSEDAIISKTLEGRITSWNAGATRIFGYLPEEMIGQPIIRIIPEELRQEEDEILSKLRRGERIDHFETVRVGKDGRRVDISLTVSPLRDRNGVIVGASKIARDITERKHHEALQRLLFDELNHRVKNTLATVQALAHQSLRRSPTSAQFVESFSGRLQALASAHDLLVRRRMRGAEVGELVHEQVLLGSGEPARISCGGPRVLLGAETAVRLALVLHELATNARKYGGLSVPNGRVSITWSEALAKERVLEVVWLEEGVPGLQTPTQTGLGTDLIRRSLEACGGETVITYQPDGIRCDIRLPLPSRAPDDSRPDETMPPGEPAAEPEDGNATRGKRILVVEDETLIAMEIEADLASLGCVVIGPATTADHAMALIEAAPLDAALVDVNLNGRSSDDVAAALRERSVPFAFATGYGRKGLPGPFQDTAVIVKPFNKEQLLHTINRLLATSPVDVASRRL